MTAIFIISIFVLVLTSLAIYRSKRSTPATDAEDALPPPHFAGLFDNRRADEDLPNAAEDRLAAEREREEHVQSLRVRAARGEREVLLDAHARRNKVLYDDLLALLIAQATNDDALRSLVSFVAAQHQLRANNALAEAFRQLYLCAPDAASTGEMLHVAALSDEAETYAQAVETALGLWHAGKLPALAASNLEALIESEYWVLAPEARASGVGFMLKQTLADARRRLQTSAARRPRLASETQE